MKGPLLDEAVAVMAAADVFAERLGLSRLAADLPATLGELQAAIVRLLAVTS